jgi:hypothetical protein
VERESLNPLGDHPGNFLLGLRDLLRGDEVAMSDPGAVMIVLGCAAACVGVVHSISNTVIRLRQPQKVALQSPAALSEDRMQRLEASVEAIAIEVERISEGQRFTTKLLSENSHRAAPPRIAPGKFDTPH